MFDPMQTRWWIKPLGHYADYVTRHMVCIMPTGSGKTTFFEAITCWIASESPGSYLYASQTDKDAEFWKETRAVKSLRGCKPLDNLWPSNIRNADRKDALVWPHMFMLFGGANMSNFQEKSITYGLGDEAWAWKRPMVREWLGRHHNRENRKFTLVSQGGEIAAEDAVGETSELHLEHDKCRKWDFAWKCKYCGVAHPFRFEQLQWDEIKHPNGLPDDQASADTTRRVCPTDGCGATYRDDTATRRALHDSYTENDGYLLVNENGLRGYEGFHLDAGGIWWIPWADDVLQKIAADRQNDLGDSSQLKQWHQKRRAVGWSESSAVQKLELKRSGYTETDYTDARKIDDEAARFMTVDPGGDHFWVAIRAWSHGGSSKLLFFGYLGKESEIVSHEEQYAVPKNCVFVDIGFNQGETADLIARNGWRGVKGKSDSGDNITQVYDWEITSGANKGKVEQRLYSKKRFVRSKTGKMIEYFLLSTERLQYILQRLIDGEGAEWLAYDDAPPSYLKHLTGERLVTATNGRNREVKKWKRFGANHGRDLEIYSLAAAFMWKLFRPAPEDLDPPEESP